MATTNQNAWQTVKFKNFAKLQRGFDLPQQDRIKGQYPVIASTSITAFHDKYKVKAPCVTTGRSGALGEVLYTNVDCWPLNTTLYVKDYCGNDPKFVYYKLKMLGLEKFNAGAGIPTLNKNHLDTLNIKIPDFPTQTRIASVLSAYDDLIENNEKRIKALEEMAQLLYTEWFVKFKFPGHEKVKMVDSGTEYGMVPEGWVVNRLGEIADLIMGQSPTSDNYNIENQGFPFHQGVADFGYKYPVDRVYSTAGNKYAENGDLLFSVRAPVGRMNIANKKIILGRGLSAIRHKKGRQSLLCSMFANKFTEKDMIGNGAIYKSVNKVELENLNFIVPKDDISEHFEDITSSYFHEIEKMTASNIVLSKTRDLLIPQLVTGKKELKIER